MLDAKGVAAKVILDWPLRERNVCGFNPADRDDRGKQQRAGSALQDGLAIAGYISSAA